MFVNNVGPRAVLAADAEVYLSTVSPSSHSLPLSLVFLPT